MAVYLVMMSVVLKVLYKTVRHTFHTSTCKPDFLGEITVFRFPATLSLVIFVFPHEPLGWTVRAAQPHRRSLSGRGRWTRA